MNTGNRFFDLMVGPLHRGDLAELLHGKNIMPFGGEIEDDGFITVYSSIPIMR